MAFNDVVILLDTIHCFCWLMKPHFHASDDCDVRGKRHDYPHLTVAVSVVLNARFCYWQFNYDAPGQTVFFLQSHFEYFSVTSFLQQLKNVFFSIKRSILIKLPVKLTMENGMVKRWHVLEAGLQYLSLVSIRGFHQIVTGSWNRAIQTSFSSLHEGS